LFDVAPLTFILFIILTGESHHSKLAVIIGSIGGAIALLVAGTAVFLWKNKRKGYRRDVFVDVAGLSFDDSLN